MADVGDVVVGIEILMARSVGQPYSLAADKVEGTIVR
jgi:hypothetical protein